MEDYYKLRELEVKTQLSILNAHAFLTTAQMEFPDELTQSPAYDTVSMAMVDVKKYIKKFHRGFFAHIDILKIINGDRKIWICDTDHLNQKKQTVFLSEIAVQEHISRVKRSIYPKGGTSPKYREGTAQYVIKDIETGLLVSVHENKNFLGEKLEFSSDFKILYVDNISL